MSAEVFLDTNVLVYAVAKNDPRAEIATALVAKGGRISVQVLNEFAIIARRKLNWPWPDWSNLWPHSACSVLTRSLSASQPTRQRW